MFLFLIIYFKLYYEKKSYKIQKRAKRVCKNLLTKEVRFNYKNVDTEMPKVLIINMKETPQRYYHAIKECEKVGCEPIRINAITKNNYKLNRINLVKKQSYDLRDTEIYCFLSHIKAWKHIQSNKDELFMVCEDDIHFEDDFKDVYKSIKNFIGSNNWDIIFFGGSPFDFNDNIKITDNIFKFGLFTGTWAYMINPNIIDYLLENIFPLSYPLDLTITIPQTKKINTKVKYDKRFLNKLNTIGIYTRKIKTPHGDRFGIISELSSTKWNCSLSFDL